MKPHFLAMAFAAGVAFSGCGRREYTQTVREDFLKACTGSLREQLPNPSAETMAAKTRYCECSYEELKRRYPDPAQLDTLSQGLWKEVVLRNCSQEFSGVLGTLSDMDIEQIERHEAGDIPRVTAEMMRADGGALRTSMSDRCQEEAMAGGKMTAQKAKAYCDCMMDYFMEKYPTDVAVAMNNEANLPGGLAHCASSLR